MRRHLHLPVRPTSCSTSISSAGIFSLLPAALKAAGDNGGEREPGTEQASWREQKWYRGGVRVVTCVRACQRLAVVRLASHGLLLGARAAAVVGRRRSQGRINRDGRAKRVKKHPR